MSAPVLLGKVLEQALPPRGRACEALQTFVPYHGQPCDCSAERWVIVGGVLRAVCWVHGCAALNSARSRPLGWQL